MAFFHLNPFHCSVDSRSAVPAVRGLLRIIHPHQNLIVSGMHEIRDVQAKRAIAVLPSAHHFIIDPYRAVLVDASEIQVIAVTRLFLLQHLNLPVPADAPPVAEALGLPLSHLPGKRGRNRPVMRQVYRLEMLFAVFLQCKFPVIHDFRFFSWHVCSPPHRNLTVLSNLILSDCSLKI